MRPSYHAFASLGGGVLLWQVFGSWQAGVASLFTGFLIDFDHFFEYFKAGNRSLKPKDFLAFWRAYSEPKVFIIFHIVELVPVLGLLAWWGVFPAITGGLAFGLLHHILFDQVTNGVRFGGYSMIYRILVKFDVKKLFIKHGVDPF